MVTQKSVLAIVLLAVLLAAACGQAAPSPTALPSVTRTLSPTPSHTPTNTAVPTHTATLKPTRTSTPLPTATATWTVIPTPSIEMALYESKNYPIAIEYPAEWRNVPYQAGQVLGVSDGTNWFNIVEEDFTEFDLGQLTVDEYADLLVDNAKTLMPDSKVSSRRRIVNSDGKTGLVLVIDTDNSKSFAIHRLVYVHEGGGGFIASFGVYSTLYFQQLVDYVFSQFTVDGQAFHLEEG